MATTEIFYNGDDSTTLFPFPFEYITKDDVKVSINDVDTTAYTYANDTVIEMDTAPLQGQRLRIYRLTDVDDLKATFASGSSIRAVDLNNNFQQNNFAVEELRNYTWDNEIDTIHSDETWVSNDTLIATTAAMDQRFLDEADEVILSSETWASNDDSVASTASIDNRIDSKIDAAITGDIGTDGTGITITDDGDGTITLGLGVSSIDLDKIKAGDVVTSSEGWANDDNTIATTAKIDDVIDDAIANDILIDGTGLTKVTSGGQTTLGIGAGSVDLDRIKADDIITLTEQNDASVSVADTNIFTASAAARRFDTLVQTGTPTGSQWQVGKTWLQNDDDLTLSIWNGSGWTAVSSGGTFTEQPSVVYVDRASGDDNNTGHRISTPKASIGAAIDQINAEISVSTLVADGFNGGSGYVEGTYPAVSLTGGNGTGLTADITVNASGEVSTVTVNSAATLEDYSIGDVLSASDADLGNLGTGSGLAIPVVGDGDGQIIIVSAGVYRETAPMQIKRRNVSIIGQALRSCIVHPTPETETNTLFELNSGSYISSLTLTGVKAGTTGANADDAVLPADQGWNFAFYNNAFITKSPYIQNCTNFSDSEIDNNDLRAHRPRGGIAGDTDSLPTGGGLLINGATPHDNSPLRSMVCDSYTHVGLNGPGILVTNNGYAQCTSSYAFFNRYHIKCLNGGQANLAASTTDFGNQALVADGRSTTAIFSASLSTNITSGDITFTIGAPTADASWHGTATRPQSNMLVDVNGTFYSILSAVANGAGWDVTISRPDPTDRSNNLGINGDVTAPIDIDFYLRSQIASSGHTMEYVGSGTDYSALPENGGVPVEANQVVESNNGKVWTATTDHNGKFKVGDFFEVDQELGYVTIPTGSIAFDLLSDQSPQLGADLDVNGNTITGLPSTPTANDEAVSKAYVDTQIGGIDEVVEDLTPQLGGDLDVNGQTITSASNGNIVIDPDGTGTISLGADTSVTGDLTVDTNTLFVDASTNRVGVGTTSPSSLLHVKTSTGDAQVRIQSATATNGFTIDSIGGSVLLNNRDNNYTALYTNDTERLRIDSSGRVGIGTSSPAHPLHVSASVNDAVTNIVNTDTTNGYGLSVVAGGSASGRYIARFADSGNNAKAIILANGNVGIGTTSPADLLHVKSSGNYGVIRVDNSSTTGGGRYAAHQNGSLKAIFGVSGAIEGNTTSDAGVWAETGGAIRLYTNGSATESARIDTSGRLLVGKTSASGTALLQIEGGVSSVERTITASAFDLGTGNFWTCGAIAIPNPTNGVAGMSGLIRVTAAPTSFGSNWDFPGGSYTAPTTFPAVAPFYIVSSTQFYLGNWTEGIA